MTVGKDVSPLFTDVLKCITTTNLELKKLVYLYIMNYAKSNQENAILAVNTFHQVTPRALRVCLNPFTIRHTISVYMLCGHRVESSLSGPL